MSVVHNKMVDFTSCFSIFSILPELIDASISYTDIKKIELSTLPNRKLEKLDISNNFIDTIPSQTWNMPNLQILNLSYNFLYALLPYQFTNLTKLRVLDLSHNHLNSLTNKELYGLDSLKELRVNNNFLVQLSGESIQQMQQLTYLNAAHNSLKNLDTLTSLFNKIPQLKVLDLGGNKLSVVSGFPFENLTNLKELYLNENDLPMLANDSFGSMKLELLDLSGNGLSFLSSNAFSALNCGVLKLSNNQLNVTELNSALSGLRGLKELDLSTNNLTSLPVDLFTSLDCSYLVHLNFSNNQLIELPKLSPNLSVIKELDFSSNKITSIPNGFEITPNFWHRMQTRQTYYLYLHGNPFACQLCDLEALKLFEHSNYKCNNESNYYCLRCANPRSLRGHKIIDLPADANGCETIVRQVHGNSTYYLNAIITTVIIVIVIVLFLVVFNFEFFRKLDRQTYLLNGQSIEEETKIQNIFMKKDDQYV